MCQRQGYFALLFSTSLLGACQAANGPAPGHPSAGSSPSSAASGLAESTGAPRSPGVPIQFPYAENFEGLDHGQVPFGWESKGDESAFAKVIADGSAQARSGSSVLHLSDESSNDAAELKTSFGKRERGMLLYSLFVTTHRPADAYMTIGSGDGSSDRVIDVLFTLSGTVRYRSSGGDLVDIRDYSKGAWHDVAVVWDTNQGEFALTLDGEQLGRFPLASTDVPEQVTLKVGSNSKSGQSAYFDDVQMVFE